MLYKKIITSTVLFAGLTLVASAAYAQSATPTPVKTNLQEARQEFKAGSKSAAKTDLRCANITSRINARIEFYNGRKEAHLDRYNYIKERVTLLISNLKAKGFDTSKLESDLAAGKPKFDKLATDFQSFMSKLAETKNYDCGDSQGKFVDTLKAAKTLREVVMADVKDVRDYIQNTIRTDLKALRDQKPKVSPKPSA
jgi:hypothetical protein